jgi:hypothetical protein
MIAALRELIADVGLQLVDHHDRREQRRHDPANRSSIGARRDADDCVLTSAESDRTTDGGGIAGKGALPIVVGQDDDRMGAGRDVVLRAE